MELKTYFAQDASGNIIPNAQVFVYMAGTTTLASGIVDQNGAPLTNPFNADSSAAVVFAAPDGEYDVKCSGASRTVTIRAQLFDGGAFKADLASTAAGKGAGLVGFRQSATGAVDRTAQDKLAEVVSVKDFGAVGDGGVTNNLTAITNAIAAANGRIIRVPVDASGGDYAIKSGTLAIPSTARFEYEAGARIYASGGTITDAGRHFQLFGGDTGEGQGATLTRGFAVDLNGGNSGPSPASTAQFNRIKIVNDTVDGTATGPGSKVDGLLVQHFFGGAGTKGGRHAIEAILTQADVTESANSDRNYVGVVGLAATMSGDGGTALPGQGAYFGGNLLAQHFGGRRIFNLTGCEFNTIITAQAGGEEVHYHSGIQVVNGGAAQGTTIDAAVAIGTKGGTGPGGLPRVPWRNAIRIGRMNGGDPLGATSKIIVCDTAAATIDTAFDLPKCSSAILNSGDVSLRNAALVMSASGAGIELGSTSATNTPTIDFHSSGNVNDYDARIIASGGSASNGAGVITFTASVLQLSASTDVSVGATLRPTADNTTTLGRSDRRWSVVYAGTGTINTSDARAKQDIEELDDAERRVAVRLKSLVRKYRFRDAVAEKGDAARIHVGVIAQDVIAAFEAEGLDAQRYSIVCYDEWEARPEVIGADGEILEPATEAGNRYGIRYEELLAFIIAAI